MAASEEQCSVCGARFTPAFRYQTEARAGRLAYFCSQQCLGRSHAASDRDEGSLVSCSGCGSRFALRLASQVLYAGGRRRYACAMPCRQKLLDELRGPRLGEVAAAGATPLPERLRTAPMPAAPHGGQAGADEDRLREGGPRCLAVFNHKGGTGKTTTAVSLASGLAARGRRVLLVDTDAQGNVAVSLGVGSERSLYHVLVMGLRLADAVQHVRPGLDLLPANETLAAAELYLAGRQQRDRLLAQRLGPAIAGYDQVVIDCSPSLSLMNQNALVLADGVLVPVACDYLSLVGVRQVIKTVKNVNRLLHHRLQIWGVLPTFYDGRAKICREALATLQDHFGDRCLRPIRATIKLKEAPARARSIFEHAPSSHAVEDYATLVAAVIENRGRGERPAQTAAGVRPSAPSLGPTARRQA